MTGLLSSNISLHIAAAPFTRFGRLTIFSSQRRQAVSSRWGLARVLAAIALLLQIAVPSLHPPGLANAIGDLSAAFDEHALCLSGDRGTSDRPSDQTPKPAHHDFAACCFWHGHMALALAPGANLEPVAFAPSRSILTPAPQALARRLTGAIGARAPPTQA
jgi:hypothetical protein